MKPSIVICPQCNKRLPGDSEACVCGARILTNVEPDVLQDSQGGSSKPPRWVRILQRLYKPQDIGLGATVNRIAARFGGERFKVWATKIGLPCGCTEREAHWNKLYPNPHYRQP